jgi:hypothetical protein
MGDAGMPRSLADSLEGTKVDYVQLGRSGLRVSIPILGAMSFGGFDLFPCLRQIELAVVASPFRDFLCFEVSETGHEATFVVKELEHKSWNFSLPCALSCLATQVSLSKNIHDILIFLVGQAIKNGNPGSSIMKPKSTNSSKVPMTVV